MCSGGLIFFNIDMTFLVSVTLMDIFLSLCYLTRNFIYV